MGPAHRAAAAPLGLSLAVLVPWGTAGPIMVERVGPGRTADVFAVIVECLVHVSLGFAVVGCAKWNDLDHPRFKGRRHPGAAFVRLTARVGYSIRLPRDRYRADQHRGPSHCVEWCLLAGLATVAITKAIPWLEPWAWWWGLAILLGTSSHVWIDALTPSGVPVSAVWNAVVHREVWRRHAFAWKTTQLRVRAPWPMVSTAATVPAGIIDGMAEPGRSPATLPALVAYALSPGVRATTSVEVRVHTFAPRVPRVGLMPVDEKAPGCQPGLVGTDTGAEHFILVPILHGLTMAAFLATTGMLWPVLEWLTS